MTDRGWLVVHREAASGALRRGVYGVYVDGARSADLRDGQSAEITLDVGEHDVQVGTMTFPYSGTPRLLGSPVLSVEITVGETCRVTASPSDRSLLRTGVPDSLLVLTVEGADEQAASAAPVAVDATHPSAGRNFLTTAIIEAEHPWRTWQAIATTTCLVFCVWIALVSLFVAVFGSGKSGGWVLAILFGAVGAVFGLQLVVAFRVRRANAAPGDPAGAGQSA